MLNTATQKNYKLVSMILFIFFMFLIAFIFIASEIQIHALVQFDNFIISVVQSQISPLLTGIMKVFTFLGSVKWIGTVVLISALWLFIKKKWSLGWFILLSSGMGSVFNIILKNFFKRQRPDIHRLISETGYSFPSGHSMGSFIFYGALLYMIIHYTRNKRRQTLAGIIIALLIFFIGLSRIYLGVHYPSDIIGGYTAGGAWLIICVMIYRYYEFRKRL